MKTLLLGKNSLVGWELQRSLAPMGELIAQDRHSIADGGGCGCGDLSKLVGLQQIVLALRPNVIVNAVAHTAVDKAESSEPELARTLNARAPGVLAEAAHRVGALLVHYCTGHVFNGSGTIPWLETDATGPLSVYGSTKLDSERAIQTSDCRHLIFRTSWVYAACGGNFAKTMLRLAAERERLTVIGDQFGTTTGAELIADITAHAIAETQRQARQGGVYHLAAAGETSLNGYARFVIDTARTLGNLCKTQFHLISIHTNQLLTSAKSLRNGVLQRFPKAWLDAGRARRGHQRLPHARHAPAELAPEYTSQMQHTFSLVLPDWRYGVRRMLTEIL